MSTHRMRATFDHGWPQMKLLCDAPRESECHAYFTCAHESWVGSGVSEGRPWHEADLYPEESLMPRCYGEFRPEVCAYKDWLEDLAGELGSGSVEFPVELHWVGEGYEWSVVESGGMDGDGLKEENS